MKVFKFGGASINSIERINNLPGILNSYPDEKILIVISAMGKTTNALEYVADAFYKGENEKSLQLFKEIKQAHVKLVSELNIPPINTLNDFFTEVEWLLHDKPVKDHAYYYDQIVCSGELLSSTIISVFLDHYGIKNKWLDVRDIIRTDDNFREANVDQEFTGTKVNTVIIPLFNTTNIIITQGFIGSTDENESTTLGREGSDYTGALFANLLNAESLTIWKDVEGVMNADPKEFTDATFIQSLSYDEVIEMAYYGAQVIHPKTIKPLQNKNIPLYVKCFLTPASAGTLINNEHAHNLPPIIVVKQKQVLITLNSKDFSFVGEKPMAKLYEIFSELNIKANLIQNTAIKILVCLDDIDVYGDEKIETMALMASEIFDVQLEKDLTLLTIRHYNAAITDRLTKNRILVLEQKTVDTIQILMRNKN